MTNYYRAEFFKLSYNKETGSNEMQLLGNCEIDDNNVKHPDMPLTRKAALRAPYGCTMWDRIRITKVYK